MQDELELCDHLSSESTPGLAIAPRDILDWYDGPAFAAVRCPQCDGCALLELLDWDISHRVRIFSARPIARDALDLYLRDVERGSCDPSRRDAELHALTLSAGPAVRLIAYDVWERSLLVNRELPERVAVPTQPWRERLREPDDVTWFELAGIAKRAAQESGGQKCPPTGTRPTDG